MKLSNFVEGIHAYAKEGGIAVIGSEELIKAIFMRGGCPCKIGIECPCPTHLQEIEKNGKCHCGLFGKL